MRTEAVLVLMLAACGTEGRDEPPHELVECFDSWADNMSPPLDQCEAACQGRPTEPGGGMCKIGTFNTGMPLYCDTGLEVEGGCCIRANVGGLQTMRFQECL